RPRAIPALVPSRAVGPSHAVGTDTLGGAARPIPGGRRRRAHDAGDVGRARRPCRPRALRAGPGLPRDPGARGALVAGRLRALLPDFLAPADPGGIREAGPRPRVLREPDAPLRTGHLKTG